MGGCTVGPNYMRPSAEAPPHIRKLRKISKRPSPATQIAKGKWWQIYNDPQLNDLEEQIVGFKPDAQGRAGAVCRRARSHPHCAQPVVSERLPAAFRRVTRANPPTGPSARTNSDYQDYQFPVDVSYEPDLWGRVRRLVEANRSEAQATAADLANVELSLQAELAVGLFRAARAGRTGKTAELNRRSYQKALELTQTRYQGGVATAVDVAQAQTQLETTRAEAMDVAVNRAAYEHAIAVLVGKPASTFSSSATLAAHAAPAGAAGSAVRSAGAAARHRRGREASARSQRANRRRQSAYYPNVTLSLAAGSKAARSERFSKARADSGRWRAKPPN